MTNLSNQRGVGLIEVMVALLLLTVAVLGYTALQGKAIQATNESFERSQSLVMMRNIAEKIHANPSAIEIYEENLNKSYASSSAPSEKCGLEGVAADFCSPEQLAVAESYNLKTKLQNYDFQIQMHPCPNTGEQVQMQQTTLCSLIVSFLRGVKPHLLSVQMMRVTV